MENPNIEARPRFDWNRWGWFGGTIGPIAFLPFSAVSLRATHPGSALLLVALFVLAATLSVVFWRRRVTLSLERALTIMLGVTFVAVIAGAFILRHHEVRGALSGQEISPQVFFIVPAAYAFAFWQVKVQARRSSRDG